MPTYTVSGRIYTSTWDQVTAKQRMVWATDETSPIKVLDFETDASGGFTTAGLSSGMYRVYVCASSVGDPFAGHPACPVKFQVDGANSTNVPFRRGVTSCLIFRKHHREPRQAGPKAAPKKAATKAKAVPKKAAKAKPKAAPKKAPAKAKAAPKKAPTKARR